MGTGGLDDTEAFEEVEELADDGGVGLGGARSSEARAETWKMVAHARERYRFAPALVVKHGAV